MRRSFLLALFVLSLAGACPARAHTDLDDQIAIATRAIEADPGAAALYLRRGELHRVHRDFAAAAADFDRAAALDPSLRIVARCRGQMLLEAGDPPAAEAFLRRYLEIVPGDARAQALHAKSLAALDRPRAAADAWDRALRSAGAEEPLVPDWVDGRNAARRAAGLPASPPPRPRHAASAVVIDRAAAPQASATLLRGPYLQMATPTSVVVRWRTDVPTNSVVVFGDAAENTLRTVRDRTRVRDHVVRLEGLQPATRYRYAAGSSSQTLSGGTEQDAFVTPPPQGERRPTRVWVLGDSGTADDNAARVRDAYGAFSGGLPPAVWLMLGDNAYGDGTDAEYQRAVFDMYPDTLRQVTLWSTFGNHDGHSAESATQTGPYYDLFTFPRFAEAGGAASHTEAYYAFDHANVHFVCLDSYESDRRPGSPMLAWLRHDLATTRQEWVVAFWHHPPYSKGSHDSDHEGELVDMREYVLPILEEHGVDLVLTGHSHSYERSFLIDGHYGRSWTFGDAHRKNAGDGDPGGDGPYEKPAGGAVAHAGAVYAVAGSSGQASGGSLDHPAMFVSLNVLGSLVLDVSGPRLDAIFLDDQGAARDRFTIVKP